VEYQLCAADELGDIAKYLEEGADEDKRDFGNIEGEGKICSHLTTLKRSLDSEHNHTEAGAPVHAEQAGDFC
jgi:hypothetical protein